MKLSVRTHAALCAVVVILCAWPANSHRPTSQAGTVTEADIERLLEWLPSDTETLYVARGPFRIARATALSALGTVLEKELQLLTYHHLLSGGEEDSFKPFFGRTIQLAVQGSRKFRAPNSLGSMTYEGCQIIWFGGEASAWDAIEKLTAERTHESTQIAGRKVYVFREKLEEDDWVFYIARPRPDIFVAATHEGYLTEVLSRMSQSATVRALSPELPEWKYIDRSAAFWALRHFDRAGAKEDPSSPFGGLKAANEPDEEAIGLAFSYSAKDGKKIRMFYLSQNKDALEVARRMWSHPDEGLLPTFRERAPGVVETTVPVPDEDALSFFTFVLYAVYGHGIYV